MGIIISVILIVAAFALGSWITERQDLKVHRKLTKQIFHEQSRVEDLKIENSRLKAQLAYFRNEYYKHNS